MPILRRVTSDEPHCDGLQEESQDPNRVHADGSQGVHQRQTGPHGGGAAPTSARRKLAYCCTAFVTVSRCCQSRQHDFFQRCTYDHPVDAGTNNLKDDRVVHPVQLDVAL